MLGEYPEATEAALCATYPGRDPIGEYWRGEISLRELRVLAQHLPPDSAAHRADPNRAGWTQDSHLLAEVIDAVRVLTELTRAANAAEGDREFVAPDRYPRPIDVARQRQEDAREKAAAAAAADWFAQQTAHITA